MFGFPVQMKYINKVKIRTNRKEGQREINKEDTCFREIL